MRAKGGKEKIKQKNRLNVREGVASSTQTSSGFAV